MNRKFTDTMVSRMGSVLDRARWTNLLSNVIAHSDSLHTHLLTFDRGLVAVSGQVISRVHNERDSALAHDEYLEYVDSDRRTEALFSRNTDTFFDHNDIVDIEKFWHSPLYNDYLKKHDAQSQLLCNLGGDGQTTLWTVIRSQKQGRYSRDEAHHLHQFLPFIRTIVSLERSLAQANALHKTHAQLLEDKNVGVLYVDSDLRIYEMSDAANKLLKKNDGVVSIAGKFAGSSQADTQRIKRLVASARTDRRLSFLFIPKANGDEFYRLSVHPIAKTHPYTNGEPDLYLMLITQTEKIAHLDTNSFQAQHNLTKAELNLCVALLNATSLNSYAQLNGVSKNTVRWTLANIFSKTNTNSQARLVALMNKFLL